MTKSAKSLVIPVEVLFVMIRKLLLTVLLSFCSSVGWSSGGELLHQMPGMRNPKMTRLYPFVCPEIPEFTFQFPIFKGWEVKNIESIKNGNEEGCIVHLDWPIKYDTIEKPRINVTKVSKPSDLKKIMIQDFKCGAEQCQRAKHNKHHVAFGRVVETEKMPSHKNPLFEVHDAIQFYDWRFLIRIEIVGNIESLGFSKSQTIQEIVDSFKWEKPALYQSRAKASGFLPLNEKSAFTDGSKGYLDGLIERLTNQKEDSNEYFARFEVDKSSETVIAYIAHQSAFFDENINTIGNPGGKNRKAYINAKTGKIEKMLLER